MSEIPTIKTRNQAKSDGDKHYFTGRPCPKGHVDFRLTSSYCCISCQREWVATERATNPEFKARQQKVCRENNLKRYHSDPVYKLTVNKDSAARYRANSKTEDGKIAQLAWGKAWRERNPKKVKEMANRWRKANRPWVAMMHSLRACMKRVRCIKSSSYVLAALGYSREEFKARIESQFLPGMSWENHGEWHIDHIRPVAMFVREGITDTCLIHSLDNLQPLWARDNQRKGARY